MAFPRRSRLSALLMLLCFLTEGFGISGVDGLLYHLNREKDIPLVHVEAAGADCHAEGCLVGFVVNGGRFLAMPSAGSISIPPLESSLAPVDRTDQVARVRHVAALPRSPPHLTR